LLKNYELLAEEIVFAFLNLVFIIYFCYH